MSDSENLKDLLLELSFKAAPETIEPIEQSQREIIISFLLKEKSARQQHRLARLLTTSGMRKHQIKSFNDFDWSFNPQTPKNEILNFRNSNWVTDPKNLVLIGAPGLGKSHLAKALCYDAILAGHQTLFISAFDLIAKIKKHRNPATLVNFFGNSLKVLAIDELGYSYYNREDMDLLFQIFSKRSEILPTIITTNTIPKDWGSIFSAATASAILDRLNFNGSFLAWEGISYR